MTQQREPLMDAIQRRLKERAVEHARLAEWQTEQRKRERQREDVVAGLFKDWLEDHENVILPDDMTTSASITTEEDCFEVFVNVSDDAWITLNESALLSSDDQISFASDSLTWTVSWRGDPSEHSIFLDAMIVALELEDEDEDQ
jgi:hypothetical protein